MCEINRFYINVFYMERMIKYAGNSLLARSFPYYISFHSTIVIKTTKLLNKQFFSTLCQYFLAYHLITLVINNKLLTHMYVVIFYFLSVSVHIVFF